MSDNTTTYLLRLSDALADVSRETRNEIVAGVREELDGLSETEAADRIRELGDPEFIAASARDEAPTDVVPSSVVPTSAAPREEARWLSLTAGILVMIGGAVVPVAGWAVGIVLMWNSRVWTKKQKWIATVLPISVGFAVSILIIAAVMIRESVISAGSGPGDGYIVEETANPLVPSMFDFAHTLVVVPVVVAVPIAFIVGIWLLMKAAKWS